MLRLRLVSSDPRSLYECIARLASAYSCGTPRCAGGGAWIVAETHGCLLSVATPKPITAPAPGIGSYASTVTLDCGALEAYPRAAARLQQLVRACPGVGLLLDA